MWPNQRLLNCQDMKKLWICVLSIQCPLWRTTNDSIKYFRATECARFTGFYSIAHEGMKNLPESPHANSCWTYIFFQAMVLHLGVIWEHSQFLASQCTVPEVKSIPSLVLGSLPFLGPEIEVPDSSRYNFTFCTSLIQKNQICWGQEHHLDNLQGHCIFQLGLHEVHRWTPWVLNWFKWSPSSQSLTRSIQKGFRWLK